MSRFKTVGRQGNVERRRKRGQKRKAKELETVGNEQIETVWMDMSWFPAEGNGLKSRSVRVWTRRGGAGG